MRARAAFDKHERFVLDNINSTNAKDLTEGFIYKAQIMKQGQFLICKVAYKINSTDAFGACSKLSSLIQSASKAINAAQDLPLREHYAYQARQNYASFKKQLGIAFRALV